MKCGRAVIGKDIVVVDPVVRSYKLLSATGGRQRVQAQTDFLEQVRGQHQDLGVRPEGLHCAQVSYAFLVVFRGGHDLEDMERGPGHIVAHHLEVDELE